MYVGDEVICCNVGETVDVMGLLLGINVGKEVGDGLCGIDVGDEVEPVGDLLGVSVAAGAATNSSDPNPSTINTPHVVEQRSSTSSSNSSNRSGPAEMPNSSSDNSLMLAKHEPVVGVPMGHAVRMKSDRKSSDR